MGLSDDNDIKTSITLNIGDVESLSEYVRYS